MERKTQKYFDEKSESYTENRKKGWLGYLVTKETNLILSVTEPKKGDYILDAGCGSGYYASLFKRDGANTLGIDMSLRMVEKAVKNGVNAVVGNIETIFLNRKFDKILLSGSLEFCNNPADAIKNMAQHLKKNGRLIILYPKKNAIGFLYYLFHLTHWIKIRLFTKREMRGFLSKENFQQINFYTATCLTRLVVAQRKI